MTANQSLYDGGSLGDYMAAQEKSYNAGKTEKESKMENVINKPAVNTAQTGESTAEVSNGGIVINAEGQVGDATTEHEVPGTAGINVDQLQSSSPTMAESLAQLDLGEEDFAEDSSEIVMPDELLPEDEGEVEETFEQEAVMDAEEMFERGDLASFLPEDLSVQTVTPTLLISVNYTGRESFSDAKKELYKCEDFGTENPINFWNPMQPMNSSHPCKGFLVGAIPHCVDYLNSVAASPLHMIGSHAEGYQTVASISDLVATVLRDKIFSVAGIDESDELGIVTSPAESLEDVPEEDIIEDHMLMFDDIFSISSYVIEGDIASGTNHQVVVHVSMKIPLLSCSPKPSKTVLSLLKYFITNTQETNIPTYLGYSFDALEAFTDVGVGDIIRTLSDNGFELQSSESIDQASLSGELVLSNELQPGESASNLFPLGGDFIAIAKLHGETEES